jgi:hypothetical protein
MAILVVNFFVGDLRIGQISTLCRGAMPYAPTKCCNWSQHLEILNWMIPVNAPISLPASNPLAWMIYFNTRIDFIYSNYSKSDLSMIDKRR